MAHATTADRWFRKFVCPASDRPLLVCFPFAGGSARWFAGLSAELTPDVRVWAVQYPGRFERTCEPLIDDLESLADQVFEAMNEHAERPVALFGHSMGAVVAFEVARRLQSADLPVARLFVSGRVAPQLRRDRNAHLLSDDGLVASAEALGGIPPGLLDRPSVRALLLPRLRSDYRAVETHRHVPGPPLTTGITALVGDADPLVSRDDAVAWCGHGLGRFALEVLPGGHFYPEQRWREVATVVRRDLGVPDRRDDTCGPAATPADDS
jgi:surfactin synthase thioesterase subunit